MDLELFAPGKQSLEQGPVECLGLTFESEEARRAYFLGKLRESLEELEAKLGGVPFTGVEDAVARLQSIEKWPMGDEEQLKELVRRMARAARREPHKDLLQLWKDEVGFPQGKMEDILRLSDPPYYTTCPNPFVEDFIRHYGKPYDPETDNYRREPFAADVSEGKNDPIYNAHSYHTKVPHKAIMRYILHYTEPGDLIFDGFCGTGMTGVAAQLCGDKKTVEALGYRVEADGTILKPEEENGQTVWRPFSKLGARRAILNDLSPAATFIAHNYNTPVDVAAFAREARRILEEVEAECGWMYLTLHNPTEEQIQRALKELDELPERKQGSPDLPWGRINYTVWSDVFICPSCAGEVVFWEAAVDKEAGKVRDEFPCPHCGARLTKRSMERAWVLRFDKAIGETVRQAKQVPVLINYSVGKKRFEKQPDAFDLALIEKIENLDIPYWYPTDRMPEGEKTRDPLNVGITHVHHFYTKRNLWVLGALRKANHGIIFSAILNETSKLSRVIVNYYFKGGGGPFVTGTPGTLYIPSLNVEKRPIFAYENRLNTIIKAWYLFNFFKSYPTYIYSCQSATKLPIFANSIDYIFTDPPPSAAT
ncbi:DNA methyltransferase [Desulfothermobacter acidiphilus]|uniref:DNA methyltransferase n=1 Tax=Desulfothermobacter acidiphilus TaxID=1938353 RepID=UPI003F89102B